MSPSARQHGRYRSPVLQALVAWGVASDVRIQFPYVLIVCVTVGCPVAVDFPFLVFGLIDTWCYDTPGGEEILGLVSQREQTAWWSYVGGAVAVAYGWWVGGREGPLRDDTVNEWVAPCRMARARRSKCESGAGVGLAKIVYNVGAWSRYPGRADGFRPEFDHPCGFRGESCRLRAWPGRQG